MAIWVNETPEFLSIHKFKQLSTEKIKQILQFVSAGGGYEEFITKKRIDRLFKLSYKLKICRPDILFAWHSWAYYKWGITNKQPLYKVTADGIYIKAKRD